MRKRGKIVLLHFIAQMPMAGIAWQALQYLVGLEKLGYETWYVENHGANPYDPRANSVMMDCSYNVAYLRDVIDHALASGPLGLLGCDQRLLSRPVARARLRAAEAPTR